MLFHDNVELITFSSRVKYPAIFFSCGRNCVKLKLLCRHKSKFSKSERTREQTRVRVMVDFGRLFINGGGVK